MAEGWATAYTRNHAFTVGGQASFREADAHPDAVEYLLGALGGDLISGFASHATRRGVEVDAMEANVVGRLNNPLVFLGVVGESGHPGFETISCTLYVSADADEAILRTIWQSTLARSPLVNTLSRCVDLTLNLHAVA
ncbi:MAG: OsmC family protein [Actinomycetota bacterium]|nr:OsmC family protein [Actinomycetota bacterium]